MKFFTKTVFGLGLLFLTSSVFAADGFYVRHISFQGLQQLNAASAMHYLPFHAGEQLTSAKSAELISALYKTGFFSDVEFYRSGDTLIIRVQERPTISELTLKGNKTITNEKLKPVLKNLHLHVGGFYDPSILNQLKQGLLGQYNNMGFYAVQVEVEVKNLPRNRVAIIIHVIEGKLQKVHSIQFTGNQAFSSHVLREQMKMRRTGLFSWFTQTDRYSDYALQQDMQNLQKFYLDHGYLEFQVTGHTAVEIPGKHSVALIIHVFEGPQYRISGYEVQAPYGDDPGIKKLMSNIRIGEVFSRQKILDLDDALNNYYADKGFAFAKAQFMPRVDQQNHTVYLVFAIVKGERVYVRRINFVGNDRTLDTVLRTRLLQMEGAPYTWHNVEGSKQQLQMLSYVKDITVDTKPVADNPDAVDLDYHVKEFNSGRASINGGWSDVEGFLYGANIVEPNFIGTGKSVSVGFTRSELSSQYSISYMDPFYTVGGITRTINLYYNQTYPSSQLNLQPYTMNDLGGQVLYGIPMALHDLFTAGFGYDYITLSNVAQVFPLAQQNQIGGEGPASPSVLQFVAANSSKINQFNLLFGWSHVTLNRGIFPTAGNSQSINETLGVKLIQNSVGYYKITYDGKWYFPLIHGFILEPHADLGYGAGLGTGINGALPFYNNFFAGGIETLPGFSPNSLGPYNTNSPWGCSPNMQFNCNRMGGNVEVLGGVNLIFPNPFGDRFRTSLFLDAGNVFDTYKAQYTAQQLLINPALQRIPYESLSFSNLRVSGGIMMAWWSPMGPIELSLGAPIVRKKTDSISYFGFTFGASI